MRQRKKCNRMDAARLLAALIFAAVVVCVLASGRSEQTSTADSEPEAVIQTAEIETVVETVDEPAEPEETEPPAPEIDEAELEMLACAIYCEAGGDACSDLCRYYVGDVVLNRVDDPRFPDTMESVLTDKGQYGQFYWTGIVWPERAQYEVEAAAVARAYDTARALLSGEHSELYGAGYIWQAEFKKGADIIYLDGIYFGR